MLKFWKEIEGVVGHRAC